MKKKVIIMLIASLLILVVIVGLIIIVNKNIKEEPVKENINVIKENEIKTVSDNIKVFTVQKYIQSYLRQINTNNYLYYIEDEKMEQSFISEWTYSLLSSEYIDKNSITVDNVYEYVDKVEEDLAFVPLKMNVLELGDTTKYAVYGFCLSDDNNKYIKDLYFIFNVDNDNNTYSIEPLNKIKSIEEIKLTDTKLAIESNNYNSYKEDEYKEEDICEQYLLMFKQLMLAKTEESYNYLNKEYKNAKFSSLQDYTKYVEDNRDRIISMGIRAYSITDDKYICKNQWNNYYIFNVKSALDYDVMLDIYTVNLKEFSDKYNNSRAEDKVAMNISKIEGAINNKDYKYVYDKLDETFKNNKFGNLENFEKYVSENFFEINKLKGESISNEGDNIYVYKINVTDTENQNSAKSLTVIMKLLDNLDFTMSFNM